VIESLTITTKIFVRAKTLINTKRINEQHCMVFFFSVDSLGVFSSAIAYLLNNSRI